MSWRPSHKDQGLVHREVTDAPVNGGGRDMIASHDRPHIPRRHQLGRFRWVIVALSAVAVCAVAAAIALTGSGRRTDARAVAATDPGTPWSSWRPPDPGLAGAQEIADYLAPYYRATAASQLAVVTVVNLNNPTSPVQVVVPAGTT